MDADAKQTEVFQKVRDRLETRLKQRLERLAYADYVNYDPGEFANMVNDIAALDRLIYPLRQVPAGQLDPTFKADLIRDYPLRQVPAGQLDPTFKADLIREHEAKLSAAPAARPSTASSG